MVSVITSKRRRAHENKNKAILDTIATADHPLFPKEISSITGLKRSTVRVYLRQLLRQGLVRQPFRGIYVINPTHGVGKPPRIQNVWLKVSRVAIPRGISEYKKSFGKVRVRVIFGAKRGNITAVLSSDSGMDLTVCTLAIECLKTAVKDSLGISITNRDICVRNCEFLEDYVGMRLEGLNCVTVESFLGSLERIYNKGAGLRSEVKVKPDSLESIYTLLKGGVTPYNVMQGMYALVKKVDDLTTTLKFQNETMIRLESLFREFIRRQLSNHFSRLFRGVKFRKEKKNDFLQICS